MNYCSNCASPVGLSIPADDNRLRYCCSNCGAIHYENPKIVIGTVSEHDGRVLLCRRAIEPRRGYWTLPAGFLENDETTVQGAIRETEEEAGASVKPLALFTVMDVVHVHQVHMFYRCEMTSPAFEAGVESLEVRLFDEAAVPWEDLAFLSSAATLTKFFEDRVSPAYKVHAGTIRDGVVVWQQ